MLLHDIRPFDRFFRIFAVEYLTEREREGGEDHCLKI